MAAKERMDVELLEDDDGELEDTQEGKYLTFMIQNEEFGLQICYVTEIIGIQTVTEVPDVPEFVRGVINLRGKVIPVMDVRQRFGLAPREYDDRTCIIVINVNDQVIGIIVDTVSEVLDIPSDQIEPAPYLTKGSDNRFIVGMGKVGDKVKMLLNVERLLWEGLEAL